MKVVIALSIVSLAAASALAYGAGAGDVAHGVGGFGLAMSEPAYMLLSGTILIGIAGAVRRLTL